MTTTSCFECVIASAHVVRLETYRRADRIVFELDSWSREARAGEVRQVVDIHDVKSVLCQRDLNDEPDVDRIAATLEELRERTVSFVDQPLGATTLVVVKAAPRQGFGPELLNALCGRSAGPVSGGAWLEEVELFTAAATDLVVIVADPDDAVDARLSAVLYGPFWLAEAMAHKVAGQFAEYERRIHPDLLAAAERLDEELRLLGDDVERPEAPSAEAVQRSLHATDRAFRAFSRAVRVMAPARQVQAMLQANLRNLDVVIPSLGAWGPGEATLRQRWNVAGQSLAQVNADLGLIEPLLTAGDWLGKVQHGWMLAALGVSESLENEQRVRDQRKSDFRNLLLAAVGVWIGLGAIWSEHISSLPETMKPVSFNDRLWQHVSVPLIGLVLMVLVAVVWRRKE
ncbi:MAG: hypothetical protein IAG10_27895 [Planctomycetaceae bacterium]|nr:hypothetical protein [Planctomycetaceae bacterium]